MRRTIAVATLANSIERAFLNNSEIAKVKRPEIFRKVVVFIITCGLDLWTISEKKLWKIRATKIRFLQILDNATIMETIRNDTYRAG